MGNSFLFVVYVHDGGRFVSLDKHDVYVGGECEGTFHLDPDKFGYFDAVDLVEKRGYVSWSKLWYQIPRTQSYRLLENDKDVMVLLSFLKPETRVLHLYVEGCNTDTSNVEGGNISKDASEEVENVSKEADNGNEAKNVCNENEGELDAFIDDFVNSFDKNEGMHLMAMVWMEILLRMLLLLRVNGQHGLDGKESDWDVNEWGDENSEDSDYHPCDGESSNDELDDTELASEDEEYVESRQKVKTRENVFDLLDQEPMNELGFKQVFENVESDYQSSDGEVCADSTDDELEGNRNMEFKSSFDPRTNPKKLELKLGMRFEDGFQCRKALRDNAIANGKFIKFEKVSKIKCQAKCRPPCNWKVYASLVEADDIFIIKIYYPKHTCTRKSNNKLVSSSWIAEKYKNVFRVYPNFSIKLLAEDIRKRYKTVVGRDRLYRARSLAQDMIRGSVEDHYALLRRYVAELIRVDRDGKYLLLLGEGAVFKGLYIGHSALRNGFKKSCRPIIGLDGCFLKTYLGGILLCAVGKDGNNQMFPIAWAVVEVENEQCWNWFLEILLDDLAISDGNGWTFISDQQKGLMNAVNKLAPLADHRNCARYVYMNWKKQHKGTSLKNIFWRTVRSTYVQEYKMHLEEMKAENQNAYEDFVARDVKRFCKAFLSLHASCDMIDNNIAETFNGYILSARGMHIIHMCEEIIRSLMVRQVEKLKKIAMVHDRVCPTIMKKLENLRAESIQAYVFPNVNQKFEVSFKGKNFVVDLRLRTCTCRKWELTGIPCVHACSAIHFQGKEPSTYVHSYYTVERYLEAYKYGIEPLVGEEMWPEAEGYKVKPPAIRKLPGRPKKVRRRDPEEDPKNPNKLRRFGLVMTCQNCKQKGHNSKTCSNEKVPEQPKGKRGRPRKYPIQPPRLQKKGKEHAAATSKSHNIGRGKEKISGAKERLTNQNTSSSIASESNVTGAKEGPSMQESRNPAAGN